MLIIEAFPALLYGLLALLVPESPRYLIANNKDEQAIEVLTKVEGPSDRRGGPDRGDPARCSPPSTSPASATCSARRGFVLPIVLVGIGLSVFQQFVGINVIFYYSSLLWQSVGYNVSNSLLLVGLHLDRQRDRHGRRDLGDRPDRPQAAGADRLRRA